MNSYKKLLTLLYGEDPVNLELENNFSEDEMLSFNEESSDEKTEVIVPNISYEGEDHTFICVSTGSQEETLYTFMDSHSGMFFTKTKEETPENILINSVIAGVGMIPKNPELGEHELF